MATVADRYEFRVSWQPFLLRPNMPEEGVPKAPNTPGNPRVGAGLKQAGAAVGIDFTGKADRYPNTLQAHALLEHTKDNLDLQNNLSEALFQAYFTDGIVPSGKSLVDVAVKAGVDKTHAQQVIASPERMEAAHEAAKNWSRKGVSGVPYFFMNGQKTFSGAQDPENFLHMFDVVADKFPLESQPQQASM